MCIKPVFVGILWHVKPRESAIRLIEHIYFYFIFYNPLLIGEIVLRDREAFHTIGLSPQCSFEFVSRHHFKIVGEIKTRRAIEDSTIGLHQLNELHLAKILRTLE